MTGCPRFFSDSPLFKDSQQKESFQRALLAWGRSHRRDFPWRNLTDPYLVWVSEIMLQQTTTKTVLSYFERFRTRFPSVESLAQAEEEEVLVYWQGLGYYRRARQLHQGAKQVVARFGGKIPGNLSELQTLPGIGRYTAGAILSFAFDRPAPILEANTRRLYARLLALQDPATSSTGERKLWNFASSILPTSRCALFNQALMDLGNLLCRPQNPLCTECPLRGVCLARAAGKTDRIPYLKMKEEKIPRFETAFLVPMSPVEKSTERRFLFIRYPASIRWGGLWDLPRFQRSADRRSSEDSLLAQRLAEFLGIGVEIGEPLFKMKHVVTRFQIDLEFCPATPSQSLSERFGADRSEQNLRFAGGEAVLGEIDYRFLTLRQALELALNTTGRKILNGLIRRQEERKGFQ